MYKGKHTCETLKAIRKQIADANEIPYEPVKCTHEGDCLGTCPACESEVRYIEDQLNIRKMAGKAVKIIGLASVMTMNPCYAEDDVLVPVDTVFSELQTEQLPADEKNVSTSQMPKDEEDELMGMVETHPVFPGGQKAMIEFIKDNIVYPDLSREAGIQGRVIVSFTVGVDGTISDIEVLRGVHPLLDAEAMRVVGKMPKWKPGKLMDKTVRTKYSLPVSFKLSEEEMNNKVDGMIPPIVSPASKKLRQLYTSCPIHAFLYTLALRARVGRWVRAFRP